MILQALTKLYEDLVKIGNGNVPLYGYSSVAVSAIVQIDMNGKVHTIIPANTIEPKKKKQIILPMQFKRSGKKAPPYFICDNAQYTLGIEKDGVTEKSWSCFETFREFHRTMLSGLDTPEVRAFLNYLEKWNPQDEENKAVLKGSQSYLNGGVIFRILESSAFLHEVPEINDCWKNHFSGEDDGNNGICLVTGQEQPIARVHNSVKGIYSDNPSPNGWTLVGFNETAFCSYGKEQSYNAPVGKYAAFAYTSALNYLLADKDNVQRIGDTTVVCWAEGAEPQYTAFSSAALWGDMAQNGWSEQDIRAAVKRLANGLYCDDLELDPARSFYILGISPNAARLSVRFFLRDSFGNLMRNVNAHHERMEIIRPGFDKYETIPLWKMLQETVNMNSRDKSPSPVMAGATARAVFAGGLYPASLLESTMLRIRAEREINRGRAAILKAYYLKNHNDQVPEEVLQVSLNEQSTNIPYALGRLFAVYEKAQEAVNPGINATIKDKYFNTAASTPATVFPILNNLYQKHLRKLKDQPGMYIYYDKMVTQIKSMLGDTLPARMALPEQASFDLGYYHQMQKLYEKKEKEN